MHYEKVIAYLKGRFGDRPMPESPYVLPWAS